MGDEDHYTAFAQLYNRLGEGRDVAFFPPLVTDPEVIRDLPMHLQDHIKEDLIKAADSLSAMSQAFAGLAHELPHLPEGEEKKVLSHDEYEELIKAERENAE